MKYLALLLLILICSAALSAQTPTPPPIPFPTPTAETTEAWQNFALETEQFSLEVPGIMSSGFVQPDATPVPSHSEGSAPNITPTPAASPTPVNLSKSRSYLTLVNGDYYFIFSDALASPSLNKMVYSFVESQAPGIDPNQIYAFTDEFDYHHKILIVKSGDRVYTFQTVSANKDSASAKRFFDGIKIKGMKLQANEIEALQNIPAGNSQLSVACNPALPPPPVPASKPTGNGIGNGTGVGAGNGSNAANSPVSSAPPPPTPVQTTSIKILSKPRSNYTDLARFYQTTGSATLRVTFRADGKVGAITAVKRLPFGLTEQSIIAACQMQFEPATKNGVPYSVVKQVQYNFTLY